MNAISVRDLRKSYGAVEAVKGVSFDVPEGSFTAFLGPNGAGKSTTISIICSLLAQDSGEADVFGMPCSEPEARAQIGVVFQEQMLDGSLTVSENVSLRGALYGLAGEALKSATEAAIDRAGASEFAHRRYGTLSGGQRRRADIARALVHGPRLLVLDEPTTGLDPQSRRRVWDTVAGLNRSGMTVLLTTHYMEEASGADDVIIIDRGSIVAHGTPSQLRADYCRDAMRVVPVDLAETEEALRGIGAEYEVSKGEITVELGSTLDAVGVIEALKGRMRAFEVREGTLDDAFIEITGRDGERSDRCWHWRRGTPCASSGTGRASSSA